MGTIKVLKDSLKTLKEKKEKHEKWIKGLKRNSQIYDVYYNTPLDSELVFLSSRDGKDFTGNILRICAELQKPEYGKLKFCIYIHSDIEKIVYSISERYELDTKRMVFLHTENDAVEWMEKAKYIVSDSGIPWKFVKRKGQIVLNTWHGTPLKVMGKYIPTEEQKVGTSQHFFLSSDYILFPSYYMKEKMLSSYMVDKIATGKALMAGYPRNSIFFDHDASKKTKEELKLVGKTVYVYMPTHRGNSVKSKNSTQLKDVIDYLSELDIQLRENEEILLKLHVFNQTKIDFVQFEHIKPFPEGYDSYDIINAADGLITDYSSIMFDYANARKKIILFTYDQEEYFEDRGTYFPLEELPFPKVKTTEALLNEMRKPIEYDDKAFLDEFCTFDNIEATEKLCRHVFLGEIVCKEEKIDNGKDNILIFGGSLAKNGITSSLYNLLNRIDKNEKNYFLAFRRQDIDIDPSRIGTIPKNIDYLPLMNDQEYTYEERKAYDAFSSSKDMDEPYPEILHRLFCREWDRYYWGVKFKNVIQFDGYGKNVTMLFMEHHNNTIFVHSDMLNEIKTKHNQHGATLRTAYKKYKHVAIVSEKLFPMTAKIEGDTKNISVVNNIHDINSVLQKAECPIEFDKDTILRCWNPGGLNSFLQDDGYRFVTIGRFSAEKGHERLISAFETFNKSYLNSKLLLIGGHGNLYEKIVQQAANSKCCRNIYILMSISNPIPILKQCDLFILSSFYEGMPMVIKEADSVGVPVICTDIPGPHDFMIKHNGYLVHNSEEGLLQGMYDFVEGKIHTLNIDYEAEDKKAIIQFMELLKENDDE